MEDKQIIALFWERSEQAIRETKKKYGKRCYSVAKRILKSHEDAEECVSDALLQAWEKIPPERPGILSAFLVRITRNLSLDRLRRIHAKKRGGGTYEAAYEELSECLPDGGFEDRLVEELALAEEMNRFLEGLSEENRIIFLRRYFYFCPVREIAQSMGVGESKVKMSLSRSRERLRRLLMGESIG